MQPEMIRNYYVPGNLNEVLSKILLNSRDYDFKILLHRQISEF